MVNVLDFVENELRTCLCELLIAEGRPVCACHHFGGEDPPVGDRCSTNDAGENGQAWVRRVSQTFNTSPDDFTFGGVACGVEAWTAQIEVGIYRCIQAIPNEDGSAPDVELYNADRELLAADRATLAQVLCCWPLAGEPVEPPGFELSVTVTSASIVPTGPTGSCAGSILTLVVDSALTAVEPEASLVASVDADPDDPTGQTAVVTWLNQPAPEQFVSRPAGGG